MCAISKLVILLLCLLPIELAAAEVQTWAGLRIANALEEGSARLRVELNGRVWRDGGMGCGEVSGLRRVAHGTHHLSFSMDGLKGREVRLTLKPGQILALVPHALALEDGSGREIRVLKLEHLKDRSERIATVVDLGCEPCRLLEIKQIGKSWAPVALRRMELARFPIVQHRGYLPMRVGRQQLHSLPVFKEGHQVVVLYERKGGGLTSLHYRDRGWPAAEGPGTDAEGL